MKTIFAIVIAGVALAKSAGADDDVFKARRLELTDAVRPAPETTFQLRVHENSYNYEAPPPALLGGILVPFQMGPLRVDYGTSVGTGGPRIQMLDAPGPGYRAMPAKVDR